MKFLCFFLDCKYESVTEKYDVCRRCGKQKRTFRSWANIGNNFENLKQMQENIMRRADLSSQYCQSDECLIDSIPRYQQNDLFIPDAPGVPDTQDYGGHHAPSDCGGGSTDYGSSSCDSSQSGGGGDYGGGGGDSGDGGASSDF